MSISYTGAAKKNTICRCAIQIVSDVRFLTSVDRFEDDHRGAVEGFPLPGRSHPTDSLLYDGLCHVRTTSLSGHTTSEVRPWHYGCRQCRWLHVLGTYQKFRCGNPMFSSIFFMNSKNNKSAYFYESVLLCLSRQLVHWDRRGWLLHLWQCYRLGVSVCADVTLCMTSYIHLIFYKWMQRVHWNVARCIENLSQCVNHALLLHRCQICTEIWAT